MEESREFFASTYDTIINFTDNDLYLIEDRSASNIVSISVSSDVPETKTNRTVTVLEDYQARDQYGDTDTFLNTSDGAHFWGSVGDDILAASEHFWQLMEMIKFS